MFVPEDPLLKYAYTRLAALSFTGRLAHPEYCRVDGAPGVRLRFEREPDVTGALIALVCGSQLRVWAEVAGEPRDVAMLVQDLLDAQARLNRGLQAYVASGGPETTESTLACLPPPLLRAP